jgi:dihydrofolate reductase
MARVVIDLSMSLDGFITGPNPDRENALGTGLGEKLHAWYFSGDELNPHSDFFKPGEGSEGVVEEMMTAHRAAIVGRNLYDMTGGWGGNHPVHGLHAFVVTHEPPKDVPQGETKFTFVTDGIESAIRQAKAAAGDKMVGVAGADVAQQALEAGLVDELMIHLVPVLLGNGITLFKHVGDQQIDLEIIEVIPAKGVTHLRFRVKRSVH